jgi:hypothetical protein
MKKLSDIIGLEDVQVVQTGVPLIDNGVMDDRDIDYLNHLEIPMLDDVAMEGIIGATIKGIPDTFHGATTEFKGWLKGIGSKRKYIDDSAADLIEWLKDKELDNRDLDLDMGSFKTWLKTSPRVMWRYYFILNNQMWSNIERDLKDGKITDLETLYNVDLKSRQETARELDSITDIKGLIKVVETYRKRCDKFFDLILTRKVKIKNAPFQVMLLGLVDLRMSVKNIVNLAL